MFTVTTAALITRLCLAVGLAVLIGINREHNNHPAGIRTHVLVCLGACIIAMIQQQIGAQTIAFALAHKDIYSAIRADPARLIAQVVSGVGFLGAGTIMTTRHNITGLTTAASLWATAGIGLAVGMGYYPIAVGGTITVLLVLTILKRAIKIKPIRRLELKYVNRVETQAYIKAYFKRHHITVHGAAFSTEHVTVGSHEHLYKHIYRIELPKSLDYAQLIDDLSENDNIRTARMITI